ncbi:MAG: alpha/beta hydrolase [Oscillospiraceae bacterium]|jgi:pimeloyl-ACP methyl ester carboxylesterase|nr:alpha/beta hydrolase [Oscillospiraceae bacterium]
MDIWKIIAGVFGLLILLEVVAGIGVFIAICVPVRKPAPQKPEHLRRQELRDKNNAMFTAYGPEDVSIQSFDSLELRAWLLPAKVPEGEAPPKRFALLSHGHHCNGPDEFSHITPFYHETLGYNILLPDHCGHGRSGGKWIGFGALDWRNLNLWIKYLTERFGEDIEIILHGISMGAATVMLLNENNPPPQVKLVIEDCGFSSEKAEMRGAGRMIFGALEPLFLPAYPIAGMLQSLFAGYSLKDSDPLGGMANAKCPTLFVHGGKDTFVPTRFVRELYDACPAPKKLLIVPEAIHAFSYYIDGESYRRAVTDFITEQLGHV